MKFRGNELARHTTTTVELVRAGQKYQLTVAPLAPGWESRLLMIGVLASPKAPKKVVMAGRRPLRDEAGLVVQEADEDDPQYLKQIYNANRRYVALHLAELLRCDTNLQFEAKRPEGNDLKAWEEYADALAEEIDDPVSGFTSAERDTILKAGRNATTEVDLEAATEQLLGEQ